ncbi:MAG TPA: class I SAM-dependent methyltransferase [Bradyrhizobium sp.]|nr:class I SAM-dependent methyltransferase [Bradyrhizobium sp.]
MARIGTRAEVWFSNVVASFARYVAERTLSESVPMLMRHDAVVDSFNYAKENMKGAYSFLDRFDGLGLSIKEAKRRFPSRKLVLEFGVYKGGMINYQARKFPGLDFVGFDSFEGLREQWSGMAPEKTFDLGGRLPRVRRNVGLVKGWFAESGPRWKTENPASGVPLLVHVDCDTYAATVDVLEFCSDYVEHGLVIHFDDYFGFPDWRTGGFKALQEISEKRRWRLTYLSYGTKEVAVLAEMNVG